MTHSIRDHTSTIILLVGAFILGCLLMAWISATAATDLWWASIMGAIATGVLTLALFAVNFYLGRWQQKDVTRKEPPA